MHLFCTSACLCAFSLSLSLFLCSSETVFPYPAVFASWASLPKHLPCTRVGRQYGFFVGRNWICKRGAVNLLQQRAMSQTECSLTMDDSIPSNLAACPSNRNNPLVSWTRISPFYRGFTQRPSSAGACRQLSLRAVPESAPLKGNTPQKKGKNSPRVPPQHPKRTTGYEYFLHRLDPGLTLQKFLQRS
jgi:hypothetical protein